MNAAQLQVLIVILAGWINRSQQNFIEYLQEENRILRKRRGGTRLLSTDSQRRRLAAKAKLSKPTLCLMTLSLVFNMCVTA